MTPATSSACKCFLTALMCFNYSLLTLCSSVPDFGSVKAAGHVLVLHVGVPCALQATSLPWIGTEILIGSCVDCLFRHLFLQTRCLEKLLSGFLKHPPASPEECCLLGQLLCLCLEAGVGEPGLLVSKLADLGKTISQHQGRVGASGADLAEAAVDALSGMKVRNKITLGMNTGSWLSCLFMVPLFFSPHAHKIPLITWNWKVRRMYHELLAQLYLVTSNNFQDTVRLKACLWAVFSLGSLKLLHVS